MPSCRLAVLLLASLAASAADPVASGWDHFYNLEYPEAIQDFQRAITADPGIPAYHNYLAQAVLYQELYRLGALESELLTGNNPFLRTEEIRPNPKENGRFLKAIEKAMELARTRLKQQPDDTDALYALGSAYGLRTNFHFLVQKAWRAALDDGLQARRHHNRVIELNPENADARLIQGVYDYVIGSLPWHVRVLSYLAGRSGDKKRGIVTIELVAEKGVSNRVDAQVMLAVICRREKQFAKAVEVLEPLIREYPRNFLFRLEKAHMLSDLGKKDKALACLRDLERDAAENPKIPLEKVYFEIGNVQFWYNDLEEALGNLQRVTRSPKLDLHTGALAWMRQGQILDLTERRPEALEAYRSAVRFAPQTAAAQESKRYLSSPYRRKS